MLIWFQFGMGPPVQLIPTKVSIAPEESTSECLFHFAFPVTIQPHVHSICVLRALNHPDPAWNVEWYNEHGETIASSHIVGKRADGKLRYDYNEVWITEGGLKVGCGLAFRPQGRRKRVYDTR